MGEHMDPDPIEATAERIASPLRAQETLPAGFEERLMSRVRRDAADKVMGRRTAGRASWWTAPGSITLTPLASLALAAGFAAIVVASTLMVTSAARARVPVVVARSSDTVHVVRFVFLDSNAKQIALVGDFNGWAASETPLVARDGTGMWTVSVVLRPGRHEYAFVIDGKRWAADPFALTTTDEFGTKSSIVSVGSTDIKVTN
jgi:hypothetical protein